VTHERYKSLVLEQLPELTEDQVLLETCRRNTAPCAAYAAYKIKKKDPGCESWWWPLPTISS
jgi:mannose-1-phosphate guanylyltransferase